MVTSPLSALPSAISNDMPQAFDRSAIHTPVPLDHFKPGSQLWKLVVGKLPETHLAASPVLPCVSTVELSRTGRHTKLPAPPSECGPGESDPVSARSRAHTAGVR